MANWVVEIIQQDEFGWSPTLEEAREFNTRTEARRFYEAFNVKLRNSTTDPKLYRIARLPYEKKDTRLEPNKVDFPTSSTVEDEYDN
jgi:hypothetical protein